MDDADDQPPAQEREPRFKPGRPRGSRNFPEHYYEIRRRFVEGEGIERQPDGTFKRRYLSFREMGKVFSLNPTTIHAWAKRDNWLGLRREFETLAQEQIERMRLEKAAGARASETVDALQLTDDYLKRFAAALHAGKVRVDSIADLDKVARLRAFLLTQHDPAANKGAALSLDDLQAKHAHARKRMQALPAEVTGVQAPEHGTHEQNEDGTQGAHLGKLSALA